MLERIFSRLPRLSFRFFIYFLLGLVILVLAIEGGYYFWKTKTAIKPLEIKGVFTTNIVNNKLEKAIVGTVKKIEDRDLIVEYKEQSIKIRIAENALIRTVGEGDFRRFLEKSEILIGDRVNITHLKTLPEGTLEGSTIFVLK